MPHEPSKVTNEKRISIVRGNLTNHSFFNFHLSGLTREKERKKSNCLTVICVIAKMSNPLPPSHHCEPKRETATSCESNLTHFIYLFHYMRRERQSVRGCKRSFPLDGLRGRTQSDCDFDSHEWEWEMTLCVDEMECEKLWWLLEHRERESSSVWKFFTRATLTNLFLSPAFLHVSGLLSLVEER